TTNALKLTPAEYAAERKRLGELETREAAAEVRKNSLPPTADAYKPELPKDYKFPVGAEFKIDPAAPELARLGQIAHARGWSQDEYSEILGEYAAVRASEALAEKQYYTDQVSQLGPNGPQRVDAVLKTMDGLGLGGLKGSIRTAAE